MKEDCDMKRGRMLGLCLFILCSTHGLEAQDLSHYRNFELGSDLGSVSTGAGVAASEAKTIHQRPAVLQDLEYRPSHWLTGSAAASTDPVEQIAFSFYNDQLFRIVVDYGHERTEGMTGADMIEAISTVYGPRLPQTLRAPGRAVSRLESESGSPVARWGDRQYAIVLYQTSSYGAAYRLIVTDVGRDELARRAATQALRLDDQEAPQRELARQQKERDDGRAAGAKARAVNKGVFRP
jgi:hypothetical protein